MWYAWTCTRVGGACCLPIQQQHCLPRTSMLSVNLVKSATISTNIMLMAWIFSFYQAGCIVCQWADNSSSSLNVKDIQEYTMHIVFASISTLFWCDFSRKKTMNSYSIICQVLVKVLTDKIQWFYTVTSAFRQICPVNFSASTELA